MSCIAMETPEDVRSAEKKGSATGFHGVRPTKYNALPSVNPENLEEHKAWTEALWEAYGLRLDETQERIMLACTLACGRTPSTSPRK